MQKGKYLLLFLLFFKSFSPLSAQPPKIFRVSLDSLFEIAEKNNRTLKITGYNEKIAAEQINEEKNKLLPSLDASVSVSFLGNGWMTNRNFSNSMEAPIPHYGNNFALEASQIIYAGGTINTSIKMAELNHVLAQLDKEKDKQSIRFIIAGYYLELLKLNNQKKILKNDLIQTNKLLVQIKAKCNEGTALRNNATRYELQLQSLELALLELENNSTIINNELVKTLQLPRGTKIEANEALIDSELNLADAKSLQNLATEHSPLLKQLQVHIKQSEQNQTITRSEKLPQVFAFAGNKLDGPITTVVPPINKNLNYWYVGLGVKYNIASLYKNKTKTNIAKLSTQRTLEDSSLEKEQLITDIDTAYLRYLETLKVYKTQLKKVDLATENYTIIKNRYINSLVLITEMLDAENAKVDAELQAVNAQINIRFHYYQLKKLTGTL